MFEILNVTEVKNTATVSHKVIAAMTSNQEQSILNTIDKYAEQLSMFGGIFFKKTSDNQELTGLNNKEKREAFLNEGQSTLLITFLRNSDKVVNFKAKLVKEYIDFKNNVVPLSRLELAKMQVTLIEDLERKELEVKALKTDLDDSKEWASIKKIEMATGEKYSWQVLKASSVRLGIKRKDIFDANYTTVKSYHKDLWLDAYNVDISIL